MFYFISNQWNRISKNGEFKDTQFCVKNLKKRTKRTKKIDLPEWGFEPQIFSNFPTHDLNFYE